MMKKLTALLLALTMVLSLAACSDTGGKTNDNPGSATQKLFSIYQTAPERAIIAEQEGVETDEKKLSE